MSRDILEERSSLSLSLSFYSRRYVFSRFPFLVFRSISSSAHRTICTVAIFVDNRFSLSFSLFFYLFTAGCNKNNRVGFSNGRNLKSLLDLLISSSFLSSSIFLVFLKRLKDMRDEIKSFVLLSRLLHEISNFFIKL